MAIFAAMKPRLASDCTDATRHFKKNLSNLRGPFVLAVSTVEKTAWMNGPSVLATALFPISQTGAAMSDEWDDLCNMPWVDVFTEPNFQGRIHRLHGDAATGALIIRRPHLPLFRSMIVGPVASAELQRSGNSQPIRLSPGTILPDTAPLAGRSAILSLAVLSDLD